MKMAKVKEITVGGSYTHQAAQYHPIKGEAQVTMTVEEGDELEDVQIQAIQHVTETVIAALAGIDVVHDKMYNKSLSAGDLAKEVFPDLEMDEPSGAILSDDDDWDI
jgi:hypothetical protein